MKLYTTIILLATLFFSGCAPKSGFFSEDKLYQSALTRSEKGEIYNSLELKASIVATYLNCIKKVTCSREEHEVFLVAIYIDQDSSDESKQGLMNKSFFLTLNGKKPVTIRALDYHDDLIHIAPFRNRWSKYYIVKFDKVNGETLTMDYAHKNFGKATLSFVKGH